jgi:transcriptional regulator with XRE-family HTH domain
MPKKRNTAPFERFGADMKQARKALGLSQRELAEMVQIDPRYLANIENSGSIPSLPIFYEIITICKLPAERYFYPDVAAEGGSEERERAVLKLRLCPERYLPIVEGTIDAALKLKEAGSE